MVSLSLFSLKHSLIFPVLMATLPNNGFSRTETGKLVQQQQFEPKKIDDRVRSVESCFYFPFLRPERSLRSATTATATTAATSTTRVCWTNVSSSFSTHTLSKYKTYRKFFFVLVFFPPFYMPRIKFVKDLCFSGKLCDFDGGEVISSSSLGNLRLDSLCT